MASLEGVVPPLLGQVDETMLRHEAGEQLAVSAGCAPDRRVAVRERGLKQSKPVPMSTPLSGKRSALGRSQDCWGTDGSNGGCSGVCRGTAQVQRTAPGVPRPFGDIAFAEEILLRNLGVELRLHPLVLQILGPCDEVGHCTLGSIAVIDLERQPAASQPRLHTRERLGSGARQQTPGRRIAHDWTADEVVIRGIADVLDQVRYESLGVHDVWRPRPAERA
jgi:hypothetical protein